VPDIADIIGMLDRDGALHLDEDASEYGPWPEPRRGEAIYPVDFDALAPDDRSTDESPGLDVPGSLTDVILSGEPGLRGRNNAVPSPDVLAWYQPIHFFANRWGIFIREAALVDLARDLAPQFQPFTYRRSAAAHVAALLRAGFAFLFLHEQYHHKIESLAIRLHVVERRPVYPRFKLQVANALRGTDDDLQEALANADAWIRLGHRPYVRWFPADERRVIRNWMEDLFINSPPGYRLAGRYLSDAAFLSGENTLVSQVQEGRVTPSRQYPDDFGNATHLTQALFNLKQHIWTLVPVGQRPILPTLPGVFPLATVKLQRYIRRQGWTEVPGEGKGSHTKYRKDGQMIVLPHSKDVTLPVLSSTARTLGYRPQELVELAG
jgi:hypothetical protein